MVTVQLKELQGISDALTKIGDIITDPQQKWDLGITLRQLKQDIASYNDAQAKVLTQYKEPVGNGYFSPKMKMNPETKKMEIDIESEIKATDEIVRLGNVTQQLNCPVFEYSQVEKALTSKDISLLLNKFLVNSDEVKEKP